MVTMIVTYTDTLADGNIPKEWKTFLSGKQNDDVVFINKPGVTSAYKINENLSISKISHLFIKLNNASIPYSSII